MDRFSRFLAHMNGKRVAVIGIGVSNTPLIRLLCRAGADVTACDKKDKDALGALADELTSMGAALQTGKDYLSHLSHDYIFRTPGMRPDVPELMEAAKNGSVITSEMACFFDVCPCPIFAVTGSDGKTTTTTLIAKILEQAGYTCHLGGNIGKPLLSAAERMRAEDFAVVELSSFQLFTMRKSPSVAAITNISPNHLDIHLDMEEYVAAKENIFLHQKPGGRLVLNAGNEYTARFMGKASGEVILFSGKQTTDSGFYTADGQIVYKTPSGDEIKVVALSDIFLPGSHNVENYMAAAAATLGYVSFNDVAQVARTFTGVPHRIEYVRTVGGVKYYNDSIASSPTRTVAGLRSFPSPVHLIAGGYDKKIPFDALAREAHRIKALYLTGDTSDKIAQAVMSASGRDSHALPIHRCDGLEDAVRLAQSKAVPGDVVLMSPACASFDRYKNFEERGNTFKHIVTSL